MLGAGGRERGNENKLSQDFVCTHVCDHTSFTMVLSGDVLFVTFVHAHRVDRRDSQLIQEVEKTTWASCQSPWPNGLATVYVRDVATL